METIVLILFAIVGGTWAVAAINKLQNEIEDLKVQIYGGVDADYVDQDGLIQKTNDIEKHNIFTDGVLQEVADSADVVVNVSQQQIGGDVSEGGAATNMGAVGGDAKVVGTEIKGDQNN
jgi:hypothetical protein